MTRRATITVEKLPVSSLPNSPWGRETTKAPSPPVQFLQSSTEARRSVAFLSSSSQSLVDDMAEIVGVVAAAAQLATACLSLLDATKRIKGSRLTLRRYQQQLESLQQISIRITENPLFQTPEVESQTYSILLLVKESSQTVFGERNRISQVWTLVRQEANLLEIFNSLERHKTSLLLVLDSIQATTLRQIHLNVETMASRTSPPSGYRSKPSPEPHPFAHPYYNLETTTNAIMHHVNEFTGHIGDTPGGSAPTGARRVIRLGGSVATDGSNQYNGHRIQVDSGLEDSVKNIRFADPCKVSFPISVGRGVQVNGISVESYGKLNDELVIPGADIDCFGAQVISLYAEGTVLSGEQVNGTSVILRAARD